MPKVSTKNQVTLQVAAMKEANIKSGDDIDMFVFEGNITLVRKSKGSGKGIFSHLKYNKNMSDEDSRQSVIESK